MEEKLDKLHKEIKEIFGEGVSVSLFVNSEGIQAEVHYRTNANGFTMRTINGNWIKTEVRNEN